MPSKTDVLSGQADRYVVGILILALVVLLTVAIGAVLAKGLLTLTLHLMVHGQVPALPSVRIAGFLVALTGFWWLVPSFDGYTVAASLLELVR
jgi:apolipoprotein N-acyltransferase